MITPTQVRFCAVRGVRLFETRTVRDDVRGHLTAGEFATELPFFPRRYFLTYAIPSAQTRGEHAHRACAQFLVCVNGACTIAVDDGRRSAEFRLDRPTLGIYVPPMVWAAEFQHTPDSVLMVFASHPYDAADYIRDYEEFRLLAQPLEAAVR